MFNITPVPPVVVDAPPGTEVVRVLGTGGATRMALVPYAGFFGGVRAAAGDVTGDGVADVVTAAALGGHVKVFDGTTGAEVRSFFAYPGYHGPINVAVGDVTGDGVGDIIVAAALNGHVKVIDGLTGAEVFSQFAYAGYAGSIEVTAADLDGDGFNELLTAADGGGGVHVKTFEGLTLAPRNSFFAAPQGPWADFSIAADDLDLDGVAELLVSQGPRVRVLNSRTLAVQADFLAYDPLTKDRVRVEGGRYYGDPGIQLFVVREGVGQAQVKVYTGPNFTPVDSFIAGTR
jgi:hypothetical protein